MVLLLFLGIWFVGLDFGAVFSSPVLGNLWFVHIHLTAWFKASCQLPSVS